jgi:hypothetical protein
LIKTIIRVTRHTLLRSAATGMWVERGEVAYYVCPPLTSRQPHGPQQSEAIGGIENRNHYVRDVSCDEDRSRIRDNPGIIARARSFALNQESPYEVLPTRKVCLGSVSHAISLDLTVARSVIRSRKDQLGAILC